MYVMYSVCMLSYVYIYRGVFFSSFPFRMGNECMLARLKRKKRKKRSFLIPSKTQLTCAA